MEILELMEVKRITDIFISLILIIIFFPISACIALLLLIVLGKPVLFRQIRAGKKAEPFVIYKFRTMENLFDAKGLPLPPKYRHTKIGDILRKISLDELPQLFNVLKGDMSLVGPRPLLMDYIKLYTPEQMRRHEVRPGITGWAQVNGRNAITWEDKFKLDVWYVDNCSFWIDVKILWLTFLKVIKREGTNYSKKMHSTRFTGTKK